MLPGPIHPRTLTAIGHDLALVIVIWLSVYRFRIDLPGEFHDPRLMFTTLPVVIAVQMSCFYAFGLYRGIWRYAMSCRLA